MFKKCGYEKSDKENSIQKEMIFKMMTKKVFFVSSKTKTKQEQL